jgi:uncharacterized membrane protein
MENLVVVTFTDAEKATAGLSQIKDLDRLDEITLYSLALIHKKEDGTFEFVHRESANTGEKPVFGAAAGMLIGILGGPLGMLIGSLTGAGLGFAVEDDDSEFETDFVKKVNDHIVDGTYALMMDVGEDTKFIINSNMKALGGITFHTNLDLAKDHFEQTQWDALDKGIDEEIEALKTATADKKVEIKGKIERLKAKRHAKRLKMKASIEAKKKHLHEKIAMLEKKISATNEKNKEKLKAQQSKIKENLSAFNKKVEYAFD